MPIRPHFNGAGVVYINQPPTVESRSDAIACEVSRADIDALLVGDIERTVRMASRTLSIDPPPRLRWLPADTRDIRGVVFDESLGEVWVRIQAPAATKDTALHELRHVWQLRGDRYKSAGLLTYEQRQADADDFARSWTWDMVPAASAPAAAKPVAYAHVQRAAAAAQPRSVARTNTPHRNPRPLMPSRETYQHKGRTYVVCPACDEDVPLNTTHRCPAARRSARARR